jgi:hypothetical protein
LLVAMWIAESNDVVRLECVENRGRWVDGNSRRR